MQLSSDSRTTADATGAFALMDYAEVKKYASVYGAQDIFVKTQDQALDAAVAAASLGLALDFATASAVELEDLKKQLRLSLGSAIAIAEFGSRLKAAYATALDGSSH